MGDEDTYSCILRLDLTDAARDFTEYNRQYGLITQEVLNEMGITLDDLNDETDEVMALLTEFNDKVSVRGGALQSYITSTEIPDTFQIFPDITEIHGDFPIANSERQVKTVGNSEATGYTLK